MGPLRQPGHDRLRLAEGLCGSSGQQARDARCRAFLRCHSPGFYRFSKAAFLLLKIFFAFERTPCKTKIARQHSLTWCLLATQMLASIPLHFATFSILPSHPNMLHYFRHSIFPVKASFWCLNEIAISYQSFRTADLRPRHTPRFFLLISFIPIGYSFLHFIYFISRSLPMSAGISLALVATSIAVCLLLPQIDSFSPPPRYDSCFTGLAYMADDDEYFFTYRREFEW